MASKYSVKNYITPAYYHIFNRGVEKRKIFLDKQDYHVFLAYLKTYLSPKDTSNLQTIITSTSTSSKEKDQAIKLLRLKNYFPDITLNCFALLPNHFHLLLCQRKNLISNFMNSLCTRYSMYFNRKYKRQGVLFQDVYKAVLTDTDEQLLHLSRYIHLNPYNWLNIPITIWQKSSLPSSLNYYLSSNQSPIWLNTDVILDYFSNKNPQRSYFEFLGESFDESIISHLKLDENN